MSNNSTSPYVNPSLKDLGEAAGIGQFSGASNWSVMISGFQFNGGKVSITSPTGESAVSFMAPYNKQLLGIFIQEIHTTGGAAGVVKLNSTSLSGFTLVNASAGKEYYWWSIGV
jgi:hypothetical protein